MDKEELNRAFGKYIQSIRTEKGLSQKDLAALMGNNYQNISALERGEYSPSLFYLKKLCKAFDTTLSELITNFEASYL